MTARYGVSMNVPIEARGPGGDVWTARARWPPAQNEASDRIIVVLDDDPTGPQSVHDVELAMELSRRLPGFQ